jgi:Na+/H+-translocating membrane pyrophosphatase
MVEIEEVPREKVNFSEELLRSTSFARQLADQMTLAKAYVILAKEHGNLQLAWELSSQIVFSIFLSFSLAAMYGVDVAALGMLSTIATGLAIDAYGPISDNAGGIAEMAGMSHRIHERTNALDAVGNTTAAIGKVDYMLILSEFHVIAHRTKDFSVSCDCKCQLESIHS